MLTRQAYKEREWGAFPALRKILEDKQLDWTYYGHTSVSDNVFDRLQRLMTISFLVKENINIILEKAINSDIVLALSNDLTNLERELNYAKNLFEAELHNIDNTKYKLREKLDLINKNRL